MKKLILCASLLLAGCTTIGTQPTIDEIIAQVRDYTAKTCAFLPDAANVATLVSAFVPQVGPFATVAVTVGTAICNAQAATRTAVRKGGRLTKLVRTPQGNIVPVTGRRL